MPTILVVADDAQVRRLIEKRLVQAGYTVEHANDRDEALDHYRRHPADLVITDLAMPRRSGQDLITDLLLAAPGARIIAIAGVAEKRALQEAALRGAVRTLAKPFSTEQLLEAVR